MPNQVLGTVSIDPAALGIPEMIRAIAALDAKLDAAISPNPVEKILLTQSEAAIKLGVSRRTFFDWAKGGKIPVVKIGESTFIRAASLEAFAIAHETTLAAKSA